MPVGEVYVKDVRRSFPHRDKGTFLYRFRISPDGQPVTWIDLEDNEKVPHFGQVVHIKINRTGKYHGKPGKK
jgi:hypothetical protein